MMQVERIDHLVLTAADVRKTARFYEEVCGMKPQRFDAGRLAVRLGSQKLNLNQRQPGDGPPTPLDFCLVTHASPAAIAKHLAVAEVDVGLGPVRRTGALGPMTSFYVLDPDANIVEISTYVATLDD